MNLNEAIKVLKNLQVHDRRSIIEVDRKAIDTVVAEVEKPLPTDEEIVNEANEIGEKELWPIGRQTGFVFGAKWMRDLIRDKSEREGRAK